MSLHSAVCATVLQLCKAPLPWVCPNQSNYEYIKYVVLTIEELKTFNTHVHEDREAGTKCYSYEYSHIVQKVYRLLQGNCGRRFYTRAGYERTTYSPVVSKTKKSYWVPGNVRVMTSSELKKGPAYVKSTKAIPTVCSSQSIRTAAGGERYHSKSKYTHVVLQTLQ